MPLAPAARSLIKAVPDFAQRLAGHARIAGNPAEQPDRRLCSAARRGRPAPAAQATGSDGLHLRVSPSWQQRCGACLPSLERAMSLNQALTGSPEPSPDWPIAHPKILFVPLLAFDSSGHRLGYGGGYYDRTLGQLRKGRAHYRHRLCGSGSKAFRTNFTTIRWI